jgi:hypothetical protein
VVDAEEYRPTSRQAGLSAHNRDKFVYAVEAEVENIKEVEQMPLMFSGEHSLGFAWLIPRRRTRRLAGNKRQIPKIF